MASHLAWLVYDGIAEAAIHGDCKTRYKRNMRSNQMSAESLPRVQTAKTDAPSNHSEAAIATHPATVANTTNRNAKRSFCLSCSASITIKFADEEWTNRPTNCRMELASVRVVTKSTNAIVPAKAATIRLEPCTVAPTATSITAK